MIQDSILPRAVLFEGPPGTGKTTSAKVIASEVNVPLIYVGMENIITKWVGESEQNIAGIYQLAEKLGKAIIFIDEVDSIAMNRSGGYLLLTLNIFIFTELSFYS